MKNDVILSDSEMVAEIWKQIETAHRDKNLKKLPSLYRKFWKYKNRANRSKHQKAWEDNDG